MNVASGRGQVSRVLWIILGLNLAVAVAKLVYGWVSGAIAVSADGVHSLLDGSSNIVGLVGAHVAARPPDRSHPYGHRKFEAFAALGIAMLLVLACLRILFASLGRWREPHVPQIGVTGFVVMGATILVNLAVAHYERAQGRRLRSEVLLADAEHTRSDVWSSLLVVGSFVAVRAGFPLADAVTALIIAGIIGWAAVGIVVRSAGTLSDASRVSEEEVQAIALGVPGVRGSHGVRSRGAAGDVHVDLHILVDPRQAIADAHDIGHKVESAVRAALPDVTDVVVHVEPDYARERLEALRREG